MVNFSRAKARDRVLPSFTAPAPARKFMPFVGIVHLVLGGCDKLFIVPPVIPMHWLAGTLSDSDEKVVELDPLMNEQQFPGKANKCRTLWTVLCGLSLSPANPRFVGNVWKTLQIYWSKNPETLRIPRTVVGLVGWRKWTAINRGLSTDPGASPNPLILYSCSVNPQRQMNHIRIRLVFYSTRQTLIQCNNGE